MIPWALGTHTKGYGNGAMDGKYLEPRVHYDRQVGHSEAGW